MTAFVELTPAHALLCAPTVLALACFVLLLPLWLSAPTPGLPTALGVRGDRVLLGTERGLYEEGPSGWTLVLTRGGVRDLATQSQETLIATAAGLYVWPLGGDAPRARPLGVGARVQSVSVDRTGRAWVASEVGLFSRAPGQASFRRHTALPAGPVAKVQALDEQVWVATRGTLWVHRAGAGFVPRLRGLEAGWWELNGVVGTGSSVWLSVPKGLWSIHAGSEEPIELGVGRLRGLALARGRLWVASERGVYSFGLERVGATSARLELDGEALELKLAARGLLVATPRRIALVPLTRPPAAQLALRGVRHEGPHVASVQRAALAYLELSPARVARVDARARRAALYPEVRASFSIDRDRTRAREHDQTFSSGSVRDLLDRESDHERGMAFDVQLIWRLAKLAAPDYALSVSRERRLLIELRDQVLERVNRLYFNRLRALAALQALTPDQREARLELELRVRELAAHLDAWTGGAFSRLLRSPSGAGGSGP